MIKHIFITALFLFASLNASADFIYADDFSVGQNVSQLTPNTTLNWLNGTGNSTDSTIFSPGQFYHQHFGGLTSSETHELFPGLYEETHGSPNPRHYEALEINFATGVRSFGFKAENHTSSPFALFLYDTAGNFLEFLTASVVNTGTAFPNPVIDLKIYDATYNYTFAQDIGKIIIGGASDAGYIYALNVDVPEPSSLVLLFAGLFSVVVLRRVNSTR